MNNTERFNKVVERHHENVILSKNLELTLGREASDHATAKDFWEIGDEMRAVVSDMILDAQRLSTDELIKIGLKAIKAYELPF